MNDKNHLYTKDDRINDYKGVNKRRTQQGFSRFSVAASNAINVANIKTTSPALQITTKPQIGDPINDTFGAISLVIQIIPFSVYGSDYSVLIVNGDVEFAFDDLPMGNHFPFTIDFLVQYAPTISFSGGGGLGASATAVLTGASITSINVISGGGGYTSPPTVVISGGSGTGASATAVLTGGVVTSVSIVGGGSGYGVAPVIILDSRVINPPTLPVLTDALRVVMHFEGVWDAAGVRFTYLSGSFGGSSSSPVPAGVIDNDHLQWNATSLAWEAVQAMKFAVGVHSTTGYLRFANDATAIGWRNAANIGDLQFGTTTLDFFELTNTANGEITLQLRAQHATNPDNSMYLSQKSGATGGYGRLQTPQQMYFSAGALVDVFNYDVNRIETEVNILPISDGILSLGGNIKRFNDVWATRLIFDIGNDIGFSTLGIDVNVDNSQTFNLNVNTVQKFIISQSLSEIRGNVQLSTGNLLVSSYVEPDYMRLFKRLDPGILTDYAQVYSKEDTDLVTKLFVRWGNNAIYTLPGPIIFAGNSQILVTDTGTGNIMVTVDGTQTVSFDPNSTTFLKNIVMDTPSTNIWLGARYMKFEAMTAPSHTTATTRFLFQDSADNHLKIRTNSALIDLETGSTPNAISQGDSNVTVTDAGVGVVDISVDGASKISVIAGQSTFFNTIVLSAVGISYADGIRHTFNPNATVAGINVGQQAGNPSSLTNGDWWYNSTTNRMMFQEGNQSIPITNPDQPMGIFRTGASRYYTTPHNGKVFTTRTLINNTLYAMPFFVHKTATFANFGFYLETNGSGSVITGIYSDDGNGYPDQKLMQVTTQFSVSTGAPTPKGPQTSTPSSVTLTPGLYWLVMNSSSSTGTIDAIDYLGGGDDGIGTLGIDNGLDNGTTGLGWGWAVADTYSSTMPATFIGGGTIQLGQPFVIYIGAS